MTSFVDVLCPFRSPSSREAHYARYSEQHGEFICQPCGIDVPIGEVFALVEREVGDGAKRRRYIEIDPKAARVVATLASRAAAGHLDAAELATMVLGWAKSEFPGVAAPYLRRIIGAAMQNVQLEDRAVTG